MPQRQNLKPALADTLRQLRNDVQSGATVAHGVKTVQPGEGLQLVPPEGGAEIFWDWETANTWDTRIQEGAALIDQTRATLAQTEQTLADAQDRIGRVAAGEIEKIDGHIILNGTVDTPALNVTGEMAAAIVKSMTSETKKLVVTEEAILNRATVLEGLVTSELISQKANIADLAARIITSGKLQTDTAANRGVKIDNAGIRAWDDTGQQTIRLNGADNLVQGTFQTGTTGARIKINAVNTTAFMDLYGNSGGLDHGTIYYDAAVAGKTDAALTLTAIRDYSSNPSNPSLRLFPTRGTFAFQGVWAGNTDPLKFVVLQNAAGLGPNAYATIRVAYSSPFPTVADTTRIPVMSVESATGADVMATIVSQTQTAITVNVVNKSSGKASGTVIVKIATFVTDMTW
ncbi:hypothetical protein [Kocuria sp.]|uniref:hypothetical protein n=1 Tax=Kocuria sp. TaxID=1871328 RepID=UPI0026DB8BCB|nr:hypothetical protein [Kocuria sp.]MDO4920103.1 hypothetical protein [Kocuria sp.]